MAVRSKLTKLQLYALVLKLVEASSSLCPVCVQTNLYRLHPDSMSLFAFASQPPCQSLASAPPSMGSIKTTTRS